MTMSMPPPSTTDHRPDIPAAVARSQHSIWSAVRSGFTIWYALLGSIGAWTIHLLFLAAFVRYTCNDPGSQWVPHVVTAVTLAMAVVAMALCWRLGRLAGDEASDLGGGPLRFLGRLGLVVGVTNFALIALEELYVVVLSPRRCG